MMSMAGFLDIVLKNVTTEMEDWQLEQWMGENQLLVTDGPVESKK